MRDRAIACKDDLFKTAYPIGNLGIVFLEKVALHPQLLDERLSLIPPIALVYRYPAFAMLYPG